jgi:protein-tyrosine phosphatase
MPAAPMPAGVPEPFAAVTKNSSAAEVAAALRNTYAWYPLRFAESYGRMFNLIITDGLPVLFHCTAGKDRAGMFAAALLTVLGVPKDIVIADYLLSNDYYGTEERLAQLAKQYGLSLGATRALFGVERSYLEASFDAIDREYGSFDQYRRKALGLSDERLALLKARLLERAAR